MIELTRDCGVLAQFIPGSLLPSDLGSLLDLGAEQIFWLGVIFLGVSTVFCLVLAWALKRKKALSYFLTEGGVILGTSFLTLIIVEQVVDRRTKSVVDAANRITKVAELHLANLETQVGSAVAAEIHKQVLDQPIRYRDARMSGTLTVESDGAGKYVLMDLRSNYKVTNRSIDPLLWPIPLSLHDLSATRQSDLTSVRVLRDGKEIPQESLADKAAVVAATVRSNLTSLRLNHSIHLGPGECKEVEIEYKICAELEDNFSWRMTQVCERMALTLSFPKEGADLLDSAVTYTYPDNRDVTRCRPPAGKGGYVDAEIYGVTLPQQGILVQWSPRQ